MLSPANAYARVGEESGVVGADPHMLIVMLFDGALLKVNAAAIAMAGNDAATKGQAVSKAIEIIASGLKSSLDMSAGGDLAFRLSALYDYMVTRLLYANMHNSEAALTEVASLLNELRSAWVSIRDQVRGR